MKYLPQIIHIDTRISTMAISLIQRHAPENVSIIHTERSPETHTRVTAKVFDIVIGYHAVIMLGWMYDFAPITQRMKMVSNNLGVAAPNNPVSTWAAKKSIAEGLFCCSLYQHLRHQ